MKKYLWSSCLLTVFLFVLISATFASPGGRVKSLAKRYRNLDRKISRLVSQFNRLSSDQQTSLLSRLSDKYDDVDNDDLPDFLDAGSGRCDSDVDDDGLLDGEDRDDDDDDDSSPTPSPSSSPGGEIEIHALIQSISESSIKLNNTTFVLNGSTEYLDSDNNTITRGDFSVGECVEVEGASSGGNLVAEKVKEDDDCS